MTYDSSRARELLAAEQAKRTAALARERGKDLSALPAREAAASALLVALRAVIVETNPLNTTTGDDTETTIAISIGSGRFVRAHVRRVHDRIEIRGADGTWSAAGLRYDGAINAFVGGPSGDALTVLVSSVLSAAR